MDGDLPPFVPFARRIMRFLKSLVYPRLWIGVVGVLLLCCSSPAYAHPGWGIVVNSKGHLYFTDIDHLTIWKLLPDGSLEAAVTGVWTHHLLLDGQDNLYYEREEYRGSVGPYYSFWRLSPSGEQTLLIAPTLNREQYGGEYTVVDAAGNIYFLSGNRIIKRSPAGDLTNLAGGQSSGQDDGQGDQARFGWITGMTLGPDSALYVVDDDALRKVTLEGTVTTLVRGLLTVPPDDPFFPDGSFNRIWDLFLDTDGTAYLAYKGNRRLLQVTPEGDLTEIYHAEAPWSPMGVTVDNGNLYLLETAWQDDIGGFGPRVRRLSADGAATTLVTIGETDTKGEPELPRLAFHLTSSPNPFQNRTTLSYELAQPAHIHLSLYNSAGRLIKHLVHAYQNAGTHRVSWEGTDEAGRRVGSGVYYGRLDVGGKTYTYSLVLLR